MGSYDEGDRTPDDAGFALIVVVWALGLLALLATAFLLTTRSHVKVVSNSVANARAEAMADAGVMLAVDDLLISRQLRARERRFPVDGRAIACLAEDGHRLSVSVADEAGKIDLNFASETLLKALLVGLGHSEEDATLFADRIADYRDPDNDKRPRGAEAHEYKAASLGSGPKNAPFDAIEEVGQVLGLPGDVARALGPLVTVHSGQTGIDATVAAKPLIDMLSRKTGRLPAEFASTSRQRTFTVRAEAVMPGTGPASGGFVREAIVEIRPGRTSTWTFKRWHRATTPPRNDSEAEATPPPRC
jgi:general secretion pathway protein K